MRDKTIDIQQRFNAAEAALYKRLRADSSDVPAVRSREIVLARAEMSSLVDELLSELREGQA